jgi:predicted DNA repair protein MutK
VWSTVGFIGGYFACYVGHEVHEIKEAVVDHKHEKTDEEVDQRSGHDRRNGVDHNKRRNLLMGVALILIAVGSVVTAALSNIQQDRVTECQTNYNIAFSTILAQRAQAANQDRQVTQELLSTVANLTLADPPPAREEAQKQFTRALTKYRNTIAANDEFRQAHPIPEPPKESCG